MDFNQSYAEFCNTFWVHFEQSRYGNRKSATFHVWAQHSPAARALMRQYLESNGAPKKNPYFWVQEFNVPHPHNYNGARSFPDEPLVRAIYNGIGGIYTRREAESFNMQIKGDFVL